MSFPYLVSDVLAVIYSLCDGVTQKSLLQTNSFFTTLVKPPRSPIEGFHPGTEGLVLTYYNRSDPRQKCMISSINKVDFENLDTDIPYLLAACFQSDCPPSGYCMSYNMHRAGVHFVHLQELPTADAKRALVLSFARHFGLTLMEI